MYGILKKAAIKTASPDVHGPVLTAGYTLAAIPEKQGKLSEFKINANGKNHVFTVIDLIYVAICAGILIIE
jgi:hypothetical protein